MKALMHDMTRCIGCRGCQVSCKQWNKNPAGTSTFFAGPGYQNPADLNADTFTVITYNEVMHNNRFDWVFGKLQCKHCLEPACAAICLVNAITKTDSGAVVVDRDTCIGCEMCSTACPFGVPKYKENEAGDNKMYKCWLCFDRLEGGMENTACSKTCAPKAIILGERDEVLKEAKARIAKNPDLYINHIYGQEEAGGTCVFHISNVPFDALGFKMDVPKEVIKVSRAEIIPSLHSLHPAALVSSVFIAGVGWVIRRRNELAKV